MAKRRRSRSKSRSRSRSRSRTKTKRTRIRKAKPVRKIRRRKTTLRGLFSKARKSRARTVKSRTRRKLIKRPSKARLAAKRKTLSPTAKRILAKAIKLRTKQSPKKRTLVSSKTKPERKSWGFKPILGSSNVEEFKNKQTGETYKRDVTTYYRKEGQPGKIYSRTLTYIGDTGKVSNWGTARVKFLGFSQDEAGKDAQQRYEQNRREDRREERARLRGLQEDQTQAELEYLGELKAGQEQYYSTQERQLTKRRWGPRVARGKAALLAKLRKRREVLRPLTGYGWAEQIQKYGETTEQKLNALNRRLSGRTQKTTGRKLSGRTSRKTRR